MTARDQILGDGSNRKPVPLEGVPEWGEDVYVRVLSAKDQAELSDGAKPSEVPIRVLLHCLVDETAERILKDEDFDALASRDFPVIMRAFAFAAKLNGLSTKELEEAMESFAPAPDEYSSSG
jgi:hypothetical protein